MHYITLASYSTKFEIIFETGFIPVIIPSKQSDKVTKTILGLRKEKELEIM